MKFLSPAMHDLQCISPFSLLFKAWHCKSSLCHYIAYCPKKNLVISICICPYLMPTISEAVSTSLIPSLVFVFQLLLKCFRSFLPPMRTMSSGTNEGVNFIKEIRRWWRKKRELWYTQSADIWEKVTDVFISSSRLCLYCLFI